MRLSRYTVEAEGFDGKHLLYNTANGAFAVLEEGQEVPEQFLTELTPGEELTAQRAAFEAQRTDHSELTLVIAPTYACNLRCPYCYEQGHNAVKGKMSSEVVAAIVDFVRCRYAAHPFQRLSVQWYGGDPSLALDVVEDLSARLIAFCEASGATYDAMMLTNCNAIDEQAVELLVRSRVTSVLVTIDGFEETHNARRVSATGVNSFERNIGAVRLFVEHGIAVIANMNVDRVNWPEFYPLRDYLRSELGIELGCARLCDYGRFFGTRDFRRPMFDLFDHEEFCRLTHEAFVQDGCDAGRLSARLAPAPRFCNGQRNDYFVIDTLGDIYLCDGYIGEKEHVVGNVATGDIEAALDCISHDPYDDEQCSACEILPICQGNCDWERRASDMACHPLRMTLSDYLRDWQRLEECAHHDDGNRLVKGDCW